MKNFKTTLCFMMVSCVMYFFSGCADMQTRYPYDAERNYQCMEKGVYNEVIPYPLRDFVIKGRIYLESKVTIDVNGEKNGSEITDYMLIKEAEKIGADDIINVKIDRRE